MGDVCQVHEDFQGNSTTEFHVRHIFKTVPLLGRRKIVHLPRALPSSSPLLIFADVFKGQLDVYDAVPFSAAALRYLQGLLAINPKDRNAQLRYCFDYLEDADKVISADAHAEFGAANNAEIACAARSFSQRTLRVWMTTPKMPASRLNRYGQLLGYCGTGRDAELLERLARKIADEKETADVSGLLSGCVLLRPRQGWTCLREFIRDNSRSFMLRYSALRTIHFLHKTRPDVISRKELVAAMALLIEQPDIADLPIEDLRKWQCWELSDRILALGASSSHKAPIIHRSILRYALQCPGAKAVAFVADCRKKDAEKVSDQEELLKLEAETTSEK
jgi:hypothetical protein